MASWHLGRAAGCAIVAIAVAAPLAGCDEKAEAGIEVVRLGGEKFRLELAAEEPTRTIGLGGRNEIAEDGGMLFVFRDARPLWFVMRDCPVPIDVAFLDGSGRILVIHEMQAEAPRGVGESAAEYERRLKPYGSRFPAQFAIETRGGRMRELGLKEGERVKLDLDRLKKLAS